MKNSILIPILFILGIFGLNACNDDVICTDIFAMAGVTVHGDQPEHTYTVRRSTGDTLFRDQKLNDSLYLILDDTYLPKLKNSSDIFVFHGIVNDSIVAQEEYLISADECHIRVVTGPHDIVLKK